MGAKRGTGIEGVTISGSPRTAQCRGARAEQARRAINDWAMNRWSSWSRRRTIARAKLWPRDEERHPRLGERM